MCSIVVLTRKPQAKRRLKKEIFNIILCLFMGHKIQSWTSSVCMQISIWTTQWLIRIFICIIYPFYCKWFLRLRLKRRASNSAVSNVYSKYYFESSSTVEWFIVEYNESWLLFKRHLTKLISKYPRISNVLSSHSNHYYQNIENWIIQSQCILL